MTYLDRLLAGYEAGVAKSDGNTLESLRRALMAADGAEKRGRCLGAIAVALVKDGLSSTDSIPPPSFHDQSQSPDQDSIRVAVT